VTTRDGAAFPTQLALENAVELAVPGEATFSILRDFSVFFPLFFAFVLFFSSETRDFREFTLSQKTSRLAVRGDLTIVEMVKSMLSNIKDIIPGHHHHHASSQHSTRTQPHPHSSVHR
jgi:hypothetical protein